MIKILNLKNAMPRIGLTAKWQVAFALCAAATCAQADTADFIQAVHRDWSTPRAAAFAGDSAALVPAMQALCAAPPDKAEATLQEARRQWLSTLSSWERLSGVAFGPVLQRRSQRQIDFTPTRPRLIEKAIKAAPSSAKDMELIGSPAKGLPALEWLLWVKPVKTNSPECRYAVQVAADIQREAEAIRHEAEALAATRLTAAEAETALSEIVNQWVGGIERLLWANMEMPVRVSMTSGKQATPDFPRQGSGAAAISWAAEWDALRSLATQGEASLQALLRAQGKTKVADALAQTVKQTDISMQNLTVADHAKVLAAANELAELKSLVESEVASALGVNIGFSDADGD